MAMDGSGLAMAGAFAAIAESPGNDPLSLVARLPDVYLGPAYSNEAIKDTGLEGNAQHDRDIHEHAARLLSQGGVVARFAGRLEYGPRALGNRSIMYQTTDAC